MEIICHKCGQDHNQMLSKWCDLSILEIKYHRLEQELVKLKKENEDLKEEIEDLEKDLYEHRKYEN